MRRAEGGVFEMVCPTMTPRSACSPNIKDFTAFRSREYREVVAELHAARDALASGPHVLGLINTLMNVSEDILNYRCDENGVATGACCPQATGFLAALTAEAERIRAAGGLLDDAFFDLVENLPVEVPREAA